MMNVAKVYTPQPTLHSSFYVNKSFGFFMIQRTHKKAEITV